MDAVHHGHGYGSTQLCRAVKLIAINMHYDNTKVYVQVIQYAYLLVRSCLAIKVFIGNLPAMGRGWVIIK